MLLEPVPERWLVFGEPASQDCFLYIAHKARAHDLGDIVVVVLVWVCDDNMNPLSFGDNIKLVLEQVSDVGMVNILTLLGSHVYDDYVLTVGALNDVTVALSHGNSVQREVASLNEGEGGQEQS